MLPNNIQDRTRVGHYVNDGRGIWWHLTKDDSERIGHFRRLPGYVRKQVFQFRAKLETVKSKPCRISAGFLISSFKEYLYLQYPDPKHIPAINRRTAKLYGKLLITLAHAN